MRLMFMTAVLAAAAALSAHAAPSVQLTMRDGRVWLVARDATVSQVLDEWARVGQTSVVNAERVPGRLTLELAGMPEAQALDLLLRSAGGFVASARQGTEPAGHSRSRFERIVIVAASQAPAVKLAANEPVVQPVPAPVQTPAAVQTIAPGVQRIIGPDGQPVPDDQEDAPPPPAPRPKQVSMPPGFAAPPQTSATPAAPAAGQNVPVGSPVPGMIVAPPAPGARQPAQPQRPPR